MNARSRAHPKQPRSLPGHPYTVFARRWLFFTRKMSCDDIKVDSNFAYLVRYTSPSEQSERLVKLKCIVFIVGPRDDDGDEGPGGPFPPEPERKVRARGEMIEPEETPEAQAVYIR